MVPRIGRAIVGAWVRGRISRCCASRCAHRRTCGADIPFAPPLTICPAARPRSVLGLVGSIAIEGSTSHWEDGPPRAGLAGAAPASIVRTATRRERRCGRAASSHAEQSSTECRRAAHPANDTVVEGRPCPRRQRGYRLPRSDDVRGYLQLDKLLAAQRRSATPAPREMLFIISTRPASSVQAHPHELRRRRVRAARRAGAHLKILPGEQSRRSSSRSWPCWRRSRERVREFRHVLVPPAGSVAQHR